MLPSTAPSPVSVSFCETGCHKYFWGCAASVSLCLLVCLPIALFVPPLGLLIAALAPGAVILTLTHRMYKDQVTVGQMTYTFFECIMWMGPLLLWDLIWLLGISPSLPQDGLCSLCVLAYAIQSFFFAGFCEEAVKYFTIVRLQRSLMAPDWRCFLVYGICAGCGFASLENILYCLSGGYPTAVVRAFTAVPFHCTTAAITGLGIARRRTLDQPTPWYQVLVVPWLLHGCYDFVLFLGSESGSPVGVLGFVAVIIIELAGLAYARREAQHMQQSPGGDVKQNIHKYIVDRDPNTGVPQTLILGQPGIAMCCLSSDWVCDCCCSVCFCRSSLDRFPPIAAERSNNAYLEVSSGTNNALTV